MFQFTGGVAAMQKAFGVDGIVGATAPAVTGGPGVAGDAVTGGTAADAVHPQLKSSVARVIARMAEQGYRVRVTEMLRSQARQDELYAQGRTAPGNIVTWTRDSKHLAGLAADLIVNDSYGDPKAYELLQRIANEEGLRTLGKRDGGHVELSGVGGIASTTPGSSAAAGGMAAAVALQQKRTRNAQAHKDRVAAAAVIQRYKQSTRPLLPGVDGELPPGQRLSTLGYDMLRSDDPLSPFSVENVGNSNFGATPKLSWKSRWATAKPQLLGSGAQMVGSMGGAWLGGQVGGKGKESYASEGASIGMGLGSAFGAPGALIGGLAGGLFGGLFGKGEKPRQEPAMAALEKIERNTAQQLDLIEVQTNLLRLDSRFMNVPANFTVPTFRPGAAGSGDVSINIYPQPGQNPHTIAQAVVGALRGEQGRRGSSVDLRDM